MNTHSVLLSASMLVLSAGCTAPASNADLALLADASTRNPPSSSPTPEEFAHALFAGTTCTQFRCCETVDPSSVDEAACRDALARPTMLLAETLRQWVDEGAIYDPAAARECLAWIEGASCREIRALADAPASCAFPFRATTPLGGACSLDVSCIEGRCVDGHCAPLPALGETCTGVCVEGTICAPSDTVPRCRARAPEGDPCEDDVLCATGLECIDGACAIRTSCLRDGS